MWESLLTPRLRSLSIAQTIEIRRRPHPGWRSSCARRRDSTTARRSPPRTSPGPSTRLRDKGRPFYDPVCADVKDVKVESPLRVVFHFRTNENRELPMILGELAVLPKHWWAAATSPSR